MAPKRKTSASPRVAVVIPAHNESGRIGATVRAALTLRTVDLVLVVDDGSTDSTRQKARDAGAVVVRHSRNQGKSAAMETGAAVVAMRDAEGAPPRLLLFIDADLEDSAALVGPLIDPVISGAADFTVAVLPKPAGAGGWGLVKGLARRGIQASTGVKPRAPLSGQRCMTRPVFDMATPLAKGWGVETGMTIDLLRQGLTMEETDLELHHRISTNTVRGIVHRAGQFRDVALALASRSLRQVGSGGRRGLKKTFGRPQPPRRPPVAFGDQTQPQWQRNIS
ncbi:MAG: glycosyltransferase family 2 protein [Micrococcales bacterium]|nr:glycosyltransferase family 2 protein [Micrococcales bacterium]